MGVTSAVHWWEKSQMRVLVLGSLVVQFLLLIFTYLRRKAIPGCIRFIMWLAYLGADAIAIYALATLFNRHKDEDRGGKNTLEVVWAPILLLHLGGPDGMTAYNIEDNELWSRHLLTAVSQVTVAIYVFSKSWPPGGDKRLLQAAILLFVPGVLKCSLKPLALKRASIKSLVISPSTQSTKEQTEKDMKRLDEYVQRRAKASVREQKDEGKQNEGEMDTFERYMKGAMAFVREQKDEADALQVHPRAPVEGSDHLPSQQGDISSSQNHRQVKRKEWLLWLDLKMILYGEAYKLFVDLSSPYPLRLSIFRYFWTISEEGVDKAYGSVRQGLASAFILLYTKLKSTGLPSVRMGRPSMSPLNFLFTLIVCSRAYLPWAAIGLFHNRHGEDYSGIDVKITYALICCTSVIEFYSLYVLFLADNETDYWPEKVAQYNLTEYFVRNKNHSSMMWLASMPGCKDFVDQHWCMESCFSSSPIAGLVLKYLKAGWKEKIHDPVSYRKFNDNRGHWALESYEDKLGWSIKGPFDKSVLLWHIATDICFLRTPPDNDKSVQCRQMSNYMMYLLFVNPEMLLPCTRQYLFTIAYNELKDILGENKPSLFAAAYKELKDILMDNEHKVYRRVRNAMKELKNILADNKRNPISRSQWNPEPMKEEGVMGKISSILNKSTQASEDQEAKQGSKEEPGSEEGHIEQELEEGCKQNFITEAWALAEELVALGDVKMWEVIQGVWVEMLCFSASRCRGYLHAKALGSGGEFLSYIWLLMFYMGMETFSERLQREQLPSREANNNGAPWPSEAHSGNATTSSSTSWIASRGASSSSTSHLHTGATSCSEIHIVDMV